MKLPSNGTKTVKAPAPFNSGTSAVTEAAKPLNESTLTRSICDRVNV